MTKKKDTITLSPKHGLNPDDAEAVIRLLRTGEPLPQNIRITLCMENMKDSATATSALTGY